MSYKSLLICLFGFTSNGVFCQIPAQVIPDFKFYRQDQSIFTARDLPRGRMAFFVFFDADCEHCQLAVKNIDQHYKSFKNVMVFLISMDDQNKINHFISLYGHHLSGLNNVLVLQDKNNQFIGAFKPVRYPSMFLYSADKKLLDYEDNEETVFRFVNELSKTTK